MLKTAMIFLVSITTTVLWWWLLNVAEPVWAWLFLLLAVSIGLTLVELLHTRAWRNTNEKLTKLIRANWHR
jgi:hypothetical protein